VSGAPASRWANLLTESRNRRSSKLDTLASDRIVKLLLDEDRQALKAAMKESSSIARAADLAAERIAEGGRLLFVGAGTSGRLGVLEASECPPTFGTNPDLIHAIIAGGEGAVFRAVEGAEDREDDGRAQTEPMIRPGDVVIGISASSVTPFVRGALAAARDKRAHSVLVTCAPSRGLARIADIVIAVATGPEILTGSTRLKAGSATKAVLNAITTAAMVRLGKAYENLMVDVRPSNAKLEDRARRIVEAAGHVNPARARRLLGDADGEVKTAIVMARLGLNAADARARLREARGHVRQALSG
jgi:N-acetylmuramic acid 6-phosphate etherase